MKVEQYYEKIKVPEPVLAKYDGYLASGEPYLTDIVGAEIDCFSARFGDGKEIFLSVVACEDGVLFVQPAFMEHGEIVEVGAPEYRLSGKFRFERDGVKYVAEVVDA